MGELVNQVEILEEERAHGSGALPGAGVVRGSSIGGGVNRLLVVPVGMSASVLGDHFEGESFVEMRGEMRLVRKPELR